MYLILKHYFTMRNKTSLNTSIIKAFSILETLCAGGEMGVAEISRSLNINKSTVYRIVSTLENIGYVTQKSYKGKYLPSLKMLTIGSQMAGITNLTKVIHPLLEKLSKKFRETANLAVLEEGRVVYIDKVESSETLRMDFAIGKRAPAHPTALGKVLLAYLPSESDLEEIIARGLKRYTKKTITDPVVLKKELEKVRNEGFAVDDEELNLGIRCIGAPVLNHQNIIVAAISIAGPSVRLTRKRLNAMIDPLKSEAIAISKKLIY